MPELPEVETIKNEVKNSLLGAKIEDVCVLQSKLRKPVPANIKEMILNASIEEVQRIGKYIFIYLSNDNSLIIHLGMSGQIKLFEQKPNSLAKHDHVVIQTNKCCLIYNDARRFGMVDCCKTGEADVLKNMGDDPFDEKLTPKRIRNLFKNKKTPIKIALLDQKIINGIGNIYASEALFRAEILPTRESCTLSEKECAKLLEAIRETLTLAINAGGSTLRDYHKTDGSLGYFQNMHCVYNKTGQRCPNCTCDLKKTRGIQKIIQAGRSTFFCPQKQK